MGPKHSHGMDVYVTISSEEYRKVVPDSKGAMQLLMNLDKEHLQEAESYVEQYCETVNEDLDYQSRDMYLKEFKDTVRMFLIVGSALSAILALIGIMNFINLTYTSIHERNQELKVLWSVGMTKNQIASMLSFEGILRMCLAFVFVLSVGQLFKLFDCICHCRRYHNVHLSLCCMADVCLHTGIPVDCGKCSKIDDRENSLIVNRANDYLTVTKRNSYFIAVETYGIIFFYWNGDKIMIKAY